MTVVCSEIGRRRRYSIRRSNVGSSGIEEAQVLMLLLLLMNLHREWLAHPLCFRNGARRSNRLQMSVLAMSLNSRLYSLFSELQEICTSSPRAPTSLQQNYKSAVSNTK